MITVVDALRNWEASTRAIITIKMILPILPCLITKDFVQQYLLIQVCQWWSPWYLGKKISFVGKINGPQYFSNLFVQVFLPFWPSWGETKCPTTPVRFGICLIMLKIVLEWILYFHTIRIFFTSWIISCTLISLIAFKSHSFFVWPHF